MKSHRCYGRTLGSGRCSNQTTNLLFCNKHSFQKWILVSTLIMGSITLFASLAGIYRDVIYQEPDDLESDKLAEIVQKTEKLKRNTKQHLRIAYIACTGPYNTNDRKIKGNVFRSFLDREKPAIGNHFNPEAKSFLIKNSVYEDYKFLTERFIVHHDARGATSSITVSVSKAITLFGIEISGYEELDTEKLVSELKAEFSNKSITLSSLSESGLLPVGLYTLLVNNPEMDMPLAVSIIPGDGHHGSVDIIILLPSLRLKSFFVQNISSSVIQGVTIEGKYREAKNRILPIHTREVKKESFNLPFSLAPQEGAVIVTGLKLVSPFYAGGSLYDSLDNDFAQSTKFINKEYSGSEIHVNMFWSDPKLVNSEKVIQKLDRSNYDVFNNGFLTNEEETNFSPISIGSYFDVSNVTFRFLNDTEVYSFYREENNFDMVEISDTCECGSSPRLSVKRNENNNWNPYMEMIAGADSKGNAEDFYYDLPIETTSFAITELRGETTYFSDLSFYYLDNVSKWRSLDLLSPDTSTVEYGKGVIFKIPDVVKRRARGSKFVLAGRGYYVTEATEIAPPIPRVSNFRVHGNK